MKIRFLGLWLVGVLVLWVGCAPRQTTAPTATKPAAPTPPDTTQVPTSQEPVIIFEEEPTATSPKTESALQPAPEAKFLVQVFASRSKERANIIAEDLRQVQDYPVYVVFEDNLYKVRIGDFETRQQAEGFRDYIRGRGYPDAFVVEMKR